MKQGKLTVQFYNEIKGCIAPYDPDSVIKKNDQGEEYSLRGEERMQALGRFFEGAIRQYADFKGEIDLSVPGQATIINPTDNVADIAKSLTFTTFQHFEFDH